jgi:ribosome-associated protein
LRSEWPYPLAALVVRTGGLCYSGLDAKPYWRCSLDETELAHLLVDKLEEHQAADIVMLDLREITPLADYFVICTAESERQAKALQEILREELKNEHKTRPLSTEGEPASGWTLLDYNSVVVHIFSTQTRAYYRLEELWKAAPVVLKIQ